MFPKVQTRLSSLCHASPMVSHLCKVSSAFSSSPYFRCFLNSPQGLKELHSYNVPFDHDRDTILKEVSTQHRRRVCRGPAEARVLTLKYAERTIGQSRRMDFYAKIMSTSSVSAHEKLEFLIWSKFFLKILNCYAEVPVAIFLCRYMSEIWVKSEQDPKYLSQNKT